MTSIVKFAEIEDSIRVTRRRSSCHHQRITVSVAKRCVTCDVCHEQIDPFVMLERMAGWFSDSKARSKQTAKELKVMEQKVAKLSRQVAKLSVMIHENGKSRDNKVSA